MISPAQRNLMTARELGAECLDRAERNVALPDVGRGLVSRFDTFDCPEPDAHLIPLTHGRITYVSAIDHPPLIEFGRWIAHRGGPQSQNWYAAASKRNPETNSHSLYMHRLITDAPIGFDVDHIDGNSLNNCRSNLRILTHSQNLTNQRKQCGRHSRFKGVSHFKPADCWRAYIYIDRRYVHLGYFDDEQSAARAFDAAAVKHHGEYARLNFPHEHDIHAIPHRFPDHSLVPIAWERLTTVPTCTARK